jgi:hypothetical protein
MNKAILLFALAVLPKLGFSQYSIGNSDLRDGVNLDNADERLLLGYKLVGKKFKPALVEVTKESIWR